MSLYCLKDIQIDGTKLGGQLAARGAIWGLIFFFFFSGDGSFVAMSYKVVKILL